MQGSSVICPWSRWITEAPWPAKLQLGHAQSGDTDMVADMVAAGRKSLCLGLPGKSSVELRQVSL